MDAGEVTQEKLNHVVGYFDELNGITTRDEVKTISHIEATKQAEVENQAILSSMPEDATMNFNQLDASPSETSPINQSNKSMSKFGYKDIVQSLDDSTAEQEEHMLT